jgi:hypothetical protein
LIVEEAKIVFSHVSVEIPPPALGSSNLALDSRHATSSCTGALQRNGSGTLCCAVTIVLPTASNVCSPASLCQATAVSRAKIQKRTKYTNTLQSLDVFKSFGIETYGCLGTAEDWYMYALPSASAQQASAKGTHKQSFGKIAAMVRERFLKRFSFDVYFNLGTMLSHASKRLHLMYAEQRS